MKTIPYSRQDIRDEDIKEVVAALRSDWITQGPRVTQFEEALCDYTGAKYAVAVSSGTAALHLSMLALGVGRNDRIITSPITFSASANCALYVGARPLFVDIDDTTYHISCERLADFLKSPSNRKGIKAVIPVHFMGTVADIARIKGICDRFGIKIVEDAAHALGASYETGGKRVMVGSCRDSDAAIFSFHPIKHITTGEGGAVLTNDRKIYEAALRLKHHGIVKTRKDFWAYDIPAIGFNYRITDFQCALGISQLKRLDAIVDRRRRLVDVYNSELRGQKGLTPPYEREGTRASYHLYVTRVDGSKRNGLYRYLRRKKIFTQVNYIPVHLFSYYKKFLGYEEGDFPIAERYFRECLSLPLYPLMTNGDQRTVIKNIYAFFGKK